MSITLMNIAWDVTSLTGPQKSVLALLSSYATDEGTRIYPSVDTLAHKASICRRSVQRALQDLIQKGLLIQVRPGDGAKHRPAEYAIDLKVLSSAARPVARKYFSPGRESQDQHEDPVTHSHPVHVNHGIPRDSVSDTRCLSVQDPVTISHKPRAPKSPESPLEPSYKSSGESSSLSSTDEVRANAVPAVDHDLAWSDAGTADDAEGDTQHVEPTLNPEKRSEPVKRTQASTNVKPRSRPDPAPRSAPDRGSPTQAQDQPTATDLFGEPVPSGQGPSKRDLAETMARIWREKLTGLPAPKIITPARIRALNARLDELGGIAEWIGLCQQIERSDFLMGRTGRDFRATIDWVTKPENFAKIIDGNYDNQPARLNGGNVTEFPGGNRDAAKNSNINRRRGWNTNPFDVQPRGTVLEGSVLARKLDDC